MKINNPLDTILDSEVKVKILRFLFRTNAEWNGRQIAKEIKVTPVTAHKALRSLHREGVLLLRNVGKTHIYSLSQNNFIILNMLKPLFVKESKIMDSIFNVIRRKISNSDIKKYIISVSLFGSVGSHKDHPASDIDIIVIVRNLNVKPKAEILFDEIDKKISKEFGSILSPYINTELELKAKYKKGLNVIANILKSNELIYGTQLGRII